MTTAPDYLRARRGIASWLLTRDHKRIGIMFFFGVSLSLLVGGLLALLMRVELLTPAPEIMTATQYNRAFTHHGVIMVWMFLIPSIPGALGNFVLPMQIGAADVAFPRLNLASFYIYVLGSIVTVTAMVAGGADTGWTFYVPYSTTSPSTVAAIGIGIFILGISSIITAINFIVTMHTMRAKGVGWGKVPLFTWALYGTSIIIVLATPVLGLSLLLIAVDHAWGLGIFDPSVGGDPVLFQHLFWFYSHPAVYIMILPSMGIISELVSTFSHNRPASYWAIVISTLGIAFVGFLTWGHHMFVSGMSPLAAGIFGATSMFVAVFSAIKVFTWTATLFRGRIAFNTPMLYFLAFMFLFVFGGMTGVAVATSSLDIHWHDTYFVVAHFHFIMVGGALTAFLGGIHYWFPKVTGRLYSERWGLVAAVMVFAGFALTFTPQFLLGNLGMPRRYFTYPEMYQPLNVVSSIGAFVLAIGLLLTVLYLAIALVSGPRAGANPWGSRSYEWTTQSPPPVHNFIETPTFERGPYDYHVPAEAGIGDRSAEPVDTALEEDDELE